MKPGLPCFLDTNILIYAFREDERSERARALLAEPSIISVQALNFCDAAMVAAALHAECERFYSEDLHDGLVVDGRLQIFNPFVVGV